MTRGDELRFDDMLAAARAALRGIAGKTRADLDKDPIVGFGLVKMIEIIALPPLVSELEKLLPPPPSRQE